MPGPTPAPQAGTGGGSLAAVLRQLGINLPSPVAAGERQPWQDMPGSQPRPIADNILRALTDFPKGMLTGGGAQPGPSWENAGAIFSMLAPLLGKIVYHGSPHSFNKFDMSKVGTGEGAQAYGHGLYFADNPQVAKSYRPQTTVETIGDAAFDYYDPTHYATMIMGRAAERGLSRQQAAREMFDEAAGLADLNPALARKQTEAFQVLNSDVPLPPYKRTRSGMVADVDLPDDAIAKMLDWDAPLSQQPEPIKQLARELGFTDRTATGELYDPPGQVLYQVMAARANDPKASVGWMSGANPAQSKASSQLRKAGIPGIRYFDGMSRGAREGSRNYVVFDDQLPTIIGVNK